MSVVVRIRESPYYRGFFLMKIYGNFVGTLETVRNREVSALERFDCTAIQFLMIFFLKLFLGIGQTQSIDNIFKEFFHFFEPW